MACFRANTAWSLNPTSRTVVNPAWRALGEPNIPFGPDGLDAGALDEEGASLNPVTEAVQNADVTDGDGHGASLIGMVTMTPPMMSLSL